MFVGTAAFALLTSCGGSPAPTPAPSATPTATPTPSPTPVPTPSPCPSGEIYRSGNLDGHVVDPECNPGNAQSCVCTRADAELRALSSHGEVTSNPNRNHTWVNAIGYKKFTSLPDGCPTLLDKFRYSGRFRLPVVPRQNVYQEQNPEAVHAMIQYWDAATKTTLEGAIFIDLNPWRTCDVGEATMAVKIYESASGTPLVLWDTGLRVPCDTAWHNFKLEVDLGAKQYRSIAVDSASRDLTGHQLAQVRQDSWTGESFLSITTESEATWPQSDCRYVFWWTTEFADVLLERL
jgi:hypothetical protein